LRVYPRGGGRTSTFDMYIVCRHLDWQVASMVQVLGPLRTVFSPVEYLTLEYGRYFILSEADNEPDHTQWRELLRSFNNVKRILARDYLVNGLSRALHPDDGGSHLELLPELKELEYSPSGDDGDPFAAFIDARQNSGRPVSLVRR